MANTTKSLIFFNLLNGVPLSVVANHFKKTESEVHEIFRFIVGKINSYCFERKMPFIPCENIALARQNRVVLITLLGKINLDKEATFKNIVTREVKDVVDLRC